MSSRSCRASCLAWNSSSRLIRVQATVASQRPLVLGRHDITKAISAAPFCSAHRRDIGRDNHRSSLSSCSNSRPKWQPHAGRAKRGKSNLCAALATDEPAAEEDAEELPFAATVRLVSIQGGEYTVEGVMDSDEPAEKVYGLLADYDRVASVFSNVLQSTTHSAEGADTTLNQVCRWEFLVFSGKFDMALTVAEQPKQRAVTFSLVSSPFMRTFQGRWQVEEQEGGGCRVHHRMAVTPTLAPPRALGFYTRRIFERQVARIMSDLAEALVAHDADAPKAVQDAQEPQERGE